MGISENRDTLFGGHFQGILFYLWYETGTSVSGNTQMVYHIYVYIHTILILVAIIVTISKYMTLLNPKPQTPNPKP